ncbi:MAG: TolB family protein [Gaiellaceae bacterium]
MVKRGVVVLLAVLFAGPAGGGTRQDAGLIVFASARTSTLIPFEARSIELTTGRSRRIGVVSLPEAYDHAWSPGGRALASTGQNGDLYVSRPGGRLTRIARGLADRDNVAFWSPSSRRLAFFGVERSALSVFVVASNGRGLRRVAASVAPYRDFGPRERLSWSPDGRRLAFAVRGRLVVLRLADRRMRRLRTGRGRPGAPAWSPDGRKIAFSAQVPGERATIRTLDLATNTLRRVAAGAGIPLWSPEGRLAIHEKHRLVVLGVGVVASHSPLPAPPVWSPNSRQLVFSTRRDLVVASAEARRTRRLTTEVKRFAITVEPTWSSSGQAVYVGRRLDAGDLDLHVIRPDGTGARALTTNDVGEFDPAWSPDGRRIAYRRARDRSSDLYVMDADGTNQRRVIVDGWAPTWSPDGARLAFERDGDIWMVDIDGSDPSQLTSGPEIDGQPDWSPLGHEIAFSRDPEPGTAEIYAADVTTRSVRRITSESSRNTDCHGSWAREPAWSPDGRSIAYEVERAGYVSCLSRGHDVFVHVIASDGSGRRVVTDGGYWDATADDGALTPAWSPDAAQIAFVSSVSDPRPDHDPWVRIGIVSARGGQFRLITPRSYFAHDPDWRP